MNTGLWRGILMQFTSRLILNTSIAAAFALVVSMIEFSCPPVFAGDASSNLQYDNDPTLNKIRFLLQEKRFDEAKPILDAFLKKNPHRAMALVFRARCFVDANKYKEAIQDLKAAEKVEPTNSKIYAEEADIYAMQKQFDNGIEAATLAIKYRQGKPDKNIFHSRSMMYSAKGQFSKAVEDMDSFLKIDPGKSKAYMWRATAYEQAGQLGKALIDYETALKKSNSYEYRFHIARILEKQGKFREGIEEMTAVIKQNPEEDEAWNRRGTLYCKIGNYKEAVSDYTKALATSYGSQETIYRARGKAYEKLGQKDLAQKDFKKAEVLQKKPTVSPI